MMDGYGLVMSLCLLLLERYPDLPHRLSLLDMNTPVAQPGPAGLQMLTGFKCTNMRTTIYSGKTIAGDFRPLGT